MEEEKDQLVGQAANERKAGSNLDKADELDGQAAKPRRRRGPVIAAAVVVALIVCAGIGLVHAFSTGALAPSGAAAKYAFLSYIGEDDVTDYIMTYKEQMGYGDVADDEWAAFLAENNMTPARLRYSTVDQLIRDNLIDDWGRRLGIEVSDEDLDAYMQSMRNVYAFDDDDLWNQTLERFGRTEDQLRDTQRHALVKQRVYSEEVPLPPVDDEMFRSYLPSITATFASPTVKHSYCFKLSGLDEGGSLDHHARVENARKALLETGATKENFEALVVSLSDVDALLDTGGANGWSCDSADYSARYIQALEETEVGSVSDIFNDGDGYAFIWVDQEVALPSTDDEVQAYDISSMPTSLHDYLSDSIAYQLWRDDCTEWLNGQVADANVVLFPIPSDVPYYVEMETDADGNPVQSESE